MRLALFGPILSLVIVVVERHDDCGRRWVVAERKCALALDHCYAVRREVELTEMAI
jgi:hypothetical protein